MEKGKFKVGTRYWFDERRKTSGVFSHYNNHGGPSFTDLIGDTGWGKSKDGTVGFVHSHTFIEIKPILTIPQRVFRFIKLLFFN